MSTKRRKDGGLGGGESERDGLRKSGGGGVSEGLITDAEDMVVCLVHSGEEAAGGADG